MTEALAIIPARGGSRGFPNKNLAPLSGRPLLTHTCSAALASSRLSRVVLSTDSAEIASVGRSCGVEVPILRPPELAQDTTLILPVLQHMLRWLRDQEGYSPDLTVLLQPTSPLRRPHQIDEAIDLLITSGADRVVSVVEVPHHFNPVSVLSIVDGMLVPFLPGEGGRVQRRQEKPRVYGRNGPAIYISRTARLLEPEADLYSGVCRPYIMDEKSSVDVDSPDDLAHAAMILSSHSGGC